MIIFVHDYDVDVPYAPSEHTGVQRKTSAVVESFSQVQKNPQIPEGESVPDFEEKLRPVTAQEGEVNLLSSRSTLKFQETPFASPNISVHIVLQTVGPLRL